MAVLSFDELIAKIKTKIGEDTSDESIELLEDVTDTFNANNDGEDWKTKYEENDKEWRKKYIDRFSGSGGSEQDEEEEEEEEEKTTFEDLFKEED
jgi:hypothetical protein